MMIVYKLLEPFKIYCRHLLYRIQYAMMSKERKAFKIYNSTETVDYIIKHKCSVSRFGDGEIEMITCLLDGFEESRSSAFQNFDNHLALRLKEIIGKGYYSGCNLIVGLPYILTKHDGVKESAKKYMRRCFVNNFHILKEIIDFKEWYFDTNFTRFYIDYLDQEKGEYVNKCKKIWDKRDICIIEGTKSRLGVGNDLFDNSNSIVRILCPSTNAYEKYDEIIAATKKIPKEKLILIALGMTATVLAYDLAKEGYQAIDLGHIDIEYEWFLMRATHKVPIPRKYVNEVVEGRFVEDENEEKYTKQIIKRIS